MPLLRLATAALLAAGLFLGGCATRPSLADPEAVAEFRATNDPLEPLNRVSAGVTYALDTLLLRPAAEAYSIFVPPEARTGIRNALGNLRSPVILANNLLQGEVQQAANTVGRFLLNSTLGLGGLLDVAADLGLPARNEDFGQTLARWGVGEGPYLFLPVLGPSNPRDLAGLAVDTAFSPFTWVGGGDVAQAVNLTRSGLTVLDTREALLAPLDTMMTVSLDPYATIRSVYRQRRAMAIGDRGTTPDAALGTGFSVGMGMSAADMMPRPPPQ